MYEKTTKKTQENHSDDEDDVVVHKFSYLILKLVLKIQTKKKCTDEFIHISNDLNGHHRLIIEC